MTGKGFIYKKLTYFYFQLEVTDNISNTNLYLDFIVYSFP